MTAVLILLLLPAGMALLYGLPGRLLLPADGRDGDGEADWAEALGLGMAVVHVVAVTTVGLAGQRDLVFLDAPGVVLASLAVTVLALGLRLRRTPRPSLRELARALPPPRRALPLAAATAALFAFFLWHYDAMQLGEDTCEVRATAAINHKIWDEDLFRGLAPGGELTVVQRDFLLGQSQTRNTFLAHNQTQRLGPELLMAPLTALLDVAGFRVSYALAAALLLPLGFLAGFRVLGSRGAGWGAGLLLALAPYALGTTYLDTNAMALLWGTLALALLFRDPPSPVAAGVAAALFLATRPEEILALPFLLGYVAWRTRRAGPPAAMAAALLAAGAPAIYLHVATGLQMGVPLQALSDIKPQTYHLLGLPFRFPYLLNAPFIEEAVRSPYLAFPNTIEVPLDLFRALGVPLAALGLLGSVHLARRRPAEAVALGAVFLPLTALVLFLCNWVQPNKLGVPWTGWVAVAVALAAGGQALARRALPWPALLAVLALGAAIPPAFHAATSGWTGPVDGRPTEDRLWIIEPISPLAPDLARDDPAFVEWDRRRLSPGLLPDLGPGTWHPAVVAAKARSLWQELSAPAFRDYRRPLPDYFMKTLTGQEHSVNALSAARIRAGGDPEPFSIPEMAATVAEGPFAALDLSLEQPPGVATEALRPGTAGAGEALRLDGSRAFLIEGFRVPWSDFPENVVLATDDNGFVHVMVIPYRLPSRLEDPPFPLVRLDAARFPGGVVPLEVPEGAPLRLYQSRGFRIKRGYVWYAVAGGDGLWTSPPRAVTL